MRTRWRKIRSDLTRRRSRSVLATLSLAVGVFAVGTIYLATSDVERSFKRDFDASNPPSVVMSIEPFEPDLIERVVAQEAVGEAEGRRRLVVRAQSDGAEWVNFELVAMPDYESNRVARINPDEGDWPPAPDTIVFERASLAELGVDVGDQIRLQAPGLEPITIAVSGSAHDFWEVSPTFGGFPRGYVAMETMELLSGSPLLNTIFLRAAEDPLDRDQALEVSALVRDDVIEPAGLAVERSEIRNPDEHRVQNGLDGMLVALRLLSVFILALACVLIVNTMSALLTEQRRQLGIMKAVGATSGQLTFLYLGYALVLELAALAIAFPLSIVAGRAMAGFFATLMNFNLQRLGIPWSTLAVEAGVAIIAPTLAVIWSVRRAAGKTVRETISDYGLTSGTGAHSIPGMRFLRIPSRLALRNTFRNRARLALTLSTVALTGALLVGLLSTDRALRRVADQVAGYTDYDVELLMTEPVALDDVGPLAGEGAGVSNVEGWFRRDAFRIRPDGTENENIFLIGLPPDSASIKPTLTGGRWLEPGDEFAVVINADFLREEEDLSIGSEVELDIEGQRRSWTIVGSITTQLVGEMAYVPINTLATLIERPGQVNLVAVNLESGQDAGLASDDLERTLLDAGVPLGSVQTNADIRGQTQSLFVLLVWTLLVVAALLGVVAVVGVTGTMTLGVMERTREIGVLRAVGASSRAIRRGLLTEGLMLGFMGWLLGALLGVPVAWLLGRAIGNAFLFTPLPFAFSWLSVGIWLVATLLIGGLGATRPARAASRLTIREILSYD